MFRLQLCFVCWLGFTVAGTGDGAIESRPMPLRAASTGTLFESISPLRSGVDLVHEFPRSAPLSLMQEQGSGCGVCAGDFDGDGLPDFFVTNYDRGCRLYRNLGEWRFRDVSDIAGVRATGHWCMGATFVDVDNDGDLDLYVCCFNSPNLLFINQGNGVFKERARDFGLDWTGASVMAAFADYDKDGRLDMFLLTHRDGSSAEQHLPSNTRNAAGRGVVRLGRNGRPEVAAPFQDLFSLVDKGSGRMELAIAGQPDQLFHQERSGMFSNVTAKAKIQWHDIGLGVSWWDYNADGWPDIYVANDHKTPDRLWRNNGDGTFTDVAPTALPCVPLASMGTDVADVNNDGYLDLLATEMAGSTHARRMVIHQDFQKNEWFFSSANPRQYPRNALYLGTGGGEVFEAARLSGLNATDWTWSPKFGDFDNDGWIDLFIANGMSRDYVHADLQSRMMQPASAGWRTQPVLRERNLAFRNLGGLRFEHAELNWGLDLLSASFGACVADFDADGNLDLAVMNFGETLSLYRNREATSHRMVIRLKGTRSNAWGIGAVVRVETPRGIQMRCLHLASGHLSANEPLLHFGLGGEDRVARLTVRWPSGIQQTFQGLASDQFYTITEDAGPSEITPTKPVPSTLFLRAEAVAGLRHRERAFDDFAREPLLPWKLSQLGPGLAIGDIDGDGDDDVYLGGGAGHPGTLGVHEPGGHFRAVIPPAFGRDRECEDMGALFFDADGDGDQDLYVVSGGVECEPNSPLLQDRLYLNDGKGNFEPAPAGSLPVDRDSGSVVCAADFDRDGDLDLFVGGRLVPGQYLVMPESRLLRNEGGRFVDVTDAIAPDLRHSGLVTSALWFDADNDGWIDLVTANEWGSLKLFLNRSGHLDLSEAAGEFSKHTGLWQGLAAEDLDGDGDIDLIATNLGLNTRYRASPENPVAIWRGEFETDRPAQIFEAFSDQGVWRPFRSRAAMMAAMPSIEAGFPTFESFARATVAQLFPEKALAKASRFQITTLESVIWLNDGHGHFTFRILPRLAQIAPGFGVIAADLDGDGVSDIALAQNFHGPPSEVGRMDGGLGLLLRGGESAQFKALPPVESGLMLSGEYRALALIDLNYDGAPDLLAAQNDGGLVALENQKRPGSKWLALRLRGLAGNPTGVGGRVDVSFEGAGRRSAEVRAGGGYLSQSSAMLFFGVPSGEASARISVRWPDGTISSHSAPTDARAITLTHPARLGQ